MTYKRFRDLQQQLPFLDGECTPRNNAEREKVLSLVQPMAAEILKAVVSAETDFRIFAAQHAFARQCNNFAPTNLSALIVEKLIEVRNVKPVILTKGNFAVELGDHIIWIKKVDSNLLPKYNITKSSTKRAYQYVTDNDNVNPVLILGYQLNDHQKIAGLHLLYLRGDEKIWAPINIGDLGAKLLEGINRPEMGVASTQVEEVEIKVKKSRKRAKAV